MKRRGGGVRSSVSSSETPTNTVATIYTEPCVCVCVCVCVCIPDYMHYVLVYDCVYDTVCVPSRLPAHTCECTCSVCVCVCVCVCEGEQYTSEAQRPFGPHIIHLSLTGSQRPIGPLHSSGSSLRTSICVQDGQTRGRRADFRGLRLPARLFTVSCFLHLL